MNAHAVENSHVPKEAGKLPNGVSYLNLSYDGSYEGFKAAPNALLYAGVVHGKSGHNSDLGHITYRSDVSVAYSV